MAGDARVLGATSALEMMTLNGARALGMEVLGYDPKITVKSAWQLDSGVKQAVSPDDLVARILAAVPVE